MLKRQRINDRLSNKFLVEVLMVFVCYQSALSQCVNQFPSINLGNDTIICADQTLQLQAQGYINYHWSNDSTTTNITIQDPGIYYVNGSIIDTNFVLNGDFEGGTNAASNNFYTDYIPGNGGSWGLLSNPGQYAISTSPSLVHNNFIFCGDHTTGSGNMLIANGASTGNTIVWEQTVTVMPNTDYLFSMWQSSVENTTAPSQLRLFINNDTVSELQLCDTLGCLWTQISGTWNSGSNTTATLRIINITLLEAGNDFALDDIFFSPVCLSSDTIIVEFDTLEVDAGSDILACINDPQSIIVMANMPVSSWLWNTQETSDQITPTQSGEYVVTALNENNCTASDTVNVIIDSMNWQIDNVLATTTQCGINDGSVTAQVFGNFVVPPSYVWSGPGSNSQNQHQGMTWSALSPGWYYVEVNVAGCARFDSIKVLQENQPIASFTATPSEGYAPLNVMFNNNSSSAHQYTWDYGDGLFWDTTSLVGTAHTYDTTGVYPVMLIAQNGTCTDTAFLQITVIEPPIILPPSVETVNVFSPNNDGVNDVFNFSLDHIKAIKMTVLNRWGNVMFESTDVNFKWNGTSANGQDAISGVYFYMYEAIGLQDELIKGQGFVQLVR